MTNTPLASLEQASTPSVEAVAWAASDWMRSITETELAGIPNTGGDNKGRRDRVRAMYRIPLYTHPPIPAPESAERALEQELNAIESTLSSFDSPQAAIRALIDWHVAVATECAKCFSRVGHDPDCPLAPESGADALRTTLLLVLNDREWMSLQEDKAQLRERILDIIATAEPTNSKGAEQAAETLRPLWHDVVELVRMQTPERGTGALTAAILRYAGAAVANALLASPPTQSKGAEQAAETLKRAAGQASFCLRTFLPNDPDAQMTVRMLEAALASLPTQEVDGAMMDADGWHNFNVLQYITNWLLERNALLTPHTEESGGSLAAGMNIVESFQALIATPPPTQEGDGARERVSASKEARDGFETWFAAALGSTNLGKQERNCVWMAWCAASHQAGDRPTDSQAHPAERAGEGHGPTGQQSAGASGEQSAIVLLRRPDFENEARAAARAGDYREMSRLLRLAALERKRP